MLHWEGSAQTWGSLPVSPAAPCTIKVTALRPATKAGSKLQPHPTCCAAALILPFTFASVGLESVDHYPILVAVTGILVRLLVDTDAQG